MKQYIIKYTDGLRMDRNLVLYAASQAIAFNKARYKFGVNHSNLISIKELGIL